MSKDKLHIPYPVIVEGKYDKIRLSNVIDGVILSAAAENPHDLDIVQVHARIPCCEFEEQF